MRGGNGGDTYVVDNVGDIVDDSVAAGTVITGFDTVRASFSYTLGAAIENLVLVGTAAVGEGNQKGNVIFGNNTSNTLRGLDGNDSLWGSLGNDNLIGGRGADTLVGGDGADTASYTTYIDYIAVPLVVDLLDSSAGTGDAVGDTFDSIERVDGSGGNDILRGSHASNTLNGLVGNDILEGRGGFDVLNGSRGFDLLYGGESVDQLNGGADNDQLTGGLGGDELNGEDGYDWARYDDMGAHAGERLVIDLVVGDETGDVRTGIEGLIGSPGEDIIGGDAGSNDLWGLGGDDEVFGRGGIDFLHGGAGADFLNGGLDSDWALYDDSTVGVVARLDNPSLNTGIAAGDTYSLVEGLSGSAFGDTLVGDGQDNWLTGQAGDDTLDGGIGGDAMAGGAGDDVYHLDSISDRIVENADEGIDTIRVTALGWVLGANVENLTLVGPESNFGQGNQQANMIRGNAIANTLRGEAGADTVNGGLGDDTLSGGTGFDFVDYSDAGGGVIVDLGPTSAQDTRSAGIDALDGFEGIIGSRFDDILLRGFAPSVTLRGGLGRDTFHDSSGTDTFDGGDGSDTIDYVTDGAEAVVIDLAAGTATSVDGSLNTLFSIENIGGSAGDDRFFGNAQANRIEGRAGADRLDGRGGADRLIGGPGDDTYIVDNGLDKVTEAAGGGTDQVEAAVSYVLTAHSFVERLMTTNAAGVGAIDLTGNSLTQSIEGNNGNNVLDGGLGSDTLRGLTGLDTFDFTTALGVTNVDTILDYNVAADTIRLENAVFTGLAAGVLAAGAFLKGTAAHDADDRVIYNATNGALLFDKDGIGGTAAVRFATVSIGLSMTNADFFIT